MFTYVILLIMNYIIMVLKVKNGDLETHEARKYLAKGDNRNVKMKDLNKNTKRKK